MSTLNKIIKKYNQSDQHLIVKDKSVANLEADIEALLTEARIDAAKTIKENTEQAFINDMQVVEIFRAKDGKVTSITNTICQDYVEQLIAKKEGLCN